MDFGSSHVYAGESAVYYSSVPKETERQEEKGDITSDPIYEAIEDARKTKPNYALPDLPRRQVQENTYDSVPDEGNNKQKTAWDEVPKSKPAIPAKPTIYRSKSTEVKNNLTLAEKLKQALRERDKVLQMSKQAEEEANSSDDKTPIPPPRKARSKTVPSMSPPVPSREPIRGETRPETLNESKKQAVLIPDLLSFEDPVVPLLKPPPSIQKRKNVLPNAPFDPFSIAQNDSVLKLEKVLKPTVLTPVPANAAAEASATGSIPLDKTLSSSFASTKADSLSVVPNFADFSSKNFASANPFSDGYKPVVAPRPANEYVLNLSKPSAAQTEHNLSTEPSKAKASNGGFSKTGSLYPTLPKSVEDSVFSNSFEPVETSLEPSAPSLSATMVREDVEFLQSRLHDLFLNNDQSDVQSSVDDNSSENNYARQLKVTSLIKPSAPHLSQSMIRRDMDKAQHPIKRTPSMETVYSSADTNIVCVKLGIISDNSGSFVCQAIPSHCVTCGAISNNTTKEWKCIFCGSSNTSEIPPVPPHAAGDVTYTLQPSFNPLIANESLVVFCVDTSGSMCVASKVEHGGSSLFISRLKSLQQAITDQLNIIENKKPNCRVALVTFNSEVQVLGDGSPEQKRVLTEFELLDFDYLCHVGGNAVTPGCISKTRLQLTRAVLELKERGGTALGPALLVSTAIASRLPGSQVIVCTDGRANVGVGSLETEDDYSMCHHFYEQTTTLAASRGVIVSILSIAGSDCRLVQLGKIADKTSGKVSIVESNALPEAFGSIIIDDVLATNVSIDLVTQRQLCFNSEEGIVGSSVGKFIGNITNSSQVTFRYGIRRDGEFSNVPPPRAAHFQLKIMYRTRDGAVCMRVLTQQRMVTEDRNLVESEMNPAVIGTYASQSAARLALQGDLDTAKEITNAHKELVNRGMSMKSTTNSIKLQPESDAIYECVMKRMADINRELSQVDSVSTCSSEDQSPSATADGPKPIPEDLYDDDELCNMEQPPALPPRGPQDSTRNQPKHSKSFESLFSKLPSIPKGSLLKAKHKKSKRHKEKTAMQYKDQTAQKMFNMSKATTSSFYT